LQGGWVFFFYFSWGGGFFLGEGGGFGFFFFGGWGGFFFFREVLFWRRGGGVLVSFLPFFVGVCFSLPGVSGGGGGGFLFFHLGCWGTFLGIFLFFFLVFNFFFFPFFFFVFFFPKEDPRHTPPRPHVSKKFLKVLHSLSPPPPLATDVIEALFSPYWTGWRENGMPASIFASPLFQVRTLRPFPFFPPHGADLRGLPFFLSMHDWHGVGDCRALFLLPCIVATISSPLPLS